MFFLSSGHDIAWLAWSHIVAINTALWFCMQRIDGTEVSWGQFDSAAVRVSLRVFATQPYWSEPSFSAPKLFSTGWSCRDWAVIQFTHPFFVIFVESRKGRDRRGAELISGWWWPCTWSLFLRSEEYQKISSTDCRFLTKPKVELTSYPEKANGLREETYFPHTAHICHL